MVFDIFFFYFSVLLSLFLGFFSLPFPESRFYEYITYSLINAEASHVLLLLLLLFEQPMLNEFLIVPRDEANTCDVTSEISRTEKQAVKATRDTHVRKSTRTHPIHTHTYIHTRAYTRMNSQKALLNPRLNFAVVGRSLSERSRVGTVS